MVKVSDHHQHISSVNIDLEDRLREKNMFQSLFPNFRSSLTHHDTPLEKFTSAHEIETYLGKNKHDLGVQVS